MREQRGTGGSETQDPMRQGGGCGRITTGTRESAWEWGRPAARKDGPAKGGMGGWMDGWGWRRGHQHEEEEEGSQTTTKKGEDGMGWDGRDSDRLT